MPATDSTALPVLIVGATGSLGSKVVDELLKRGKNVRALVRPTTDASRLESRGVEIARGDMLDIGSLVAAMNGADAVITTAAGYTRGGKNANDIDTIGNANLAEAAHRTGIRRFVLTSILTSDQTPQVPHFWHKKLAEDKLEQLGVPFVALRPGAFLDQVATMAGNPLDKGRLIWMSKATVPLTFVRTSDLAAYLAAAVDAKMTPSTRPCAEPARRAFPRKSGPEATDRQVTVPGAPGGRRRSLGHPPNRQKETFVS
ncbi:SDR family oxidoreductase [Streptomyces galilaeus]